MSKFYLGIERKQKKSNMEPFLNAILSINEWLNNIVWGAPMIILIVGAGLFLSVRTGFIQFRKFSFAIKNTIGKIFLKKNRKVKSRDKGSLSPIQALTTALAATVGTGNIAGVAGAISLGGPGAIFWMWITALLGMATKYAEIVLSVRFRQRDSKGEWVGGPMYYIKNGLGEKWNWLAIVFCIFASLAAAGIGNMTQINTIADSFVSTIHSVCKNSSAEISDALIKTIIGVVCTIIVSTVVLGGLKRVGAVTEKLVPIMSLVYIGGTLTVIFSNVGNIGPAFSSILEGAFHPSAVVGGVAGITIQQAMKNGVGRGVFSNEAGLGSSPIAHATADTKSPVEQGLYGIFEVFADTLVICTLTALAILCSDVDIAYGTKMGAELSIRAFSVTFGSSAANIILTIGLTLFALSTVLSWSLYSSRCMQYIFGDRGAFIYKIIFCLLPIAGATMSLDLAWGIADTLNGLMALPNLIALFALSGTVVKLTREYFKKGKARLNSRPSVFKI